MKSQKIVPDQQSWEPWSHDQLSRRLSHVAKPWCVIGGWALCLWHGAKIREYEDLEFTILLKDLDSFRQALNDTEFCTVSDGELELLTPSQQPKADISQIWCFDRSADRWRVDMMIESGTDKYWVYKRIIESQACAVKWLSYPPTALLTSPPLLCCYLRQSIADQRMRKISPGPHLNYPRQSIYG